AIGATALLLETRRRVTGAPIVSAPLLGNPAPAGSAEAPAAAPVTTGIAATRVATLALVLAGGLFIVAVADNTARAGHRGAYGLLWIGLLAIFVPAVIHAMRVRSRREALI